jgi:PAS domain S-box-containing protein
MNGTWHCTSSCCYAAIGGAVRAGSGAGSESSGRGSPCQSVSRSTGSLEGKVASMTKSTFAQQVEMARQRLTALRDYAERSSEQESPLNQAVEDLAIALEELGVAQEELAQQNEELAATRHAVEAERRRYQELLRDITASRRGRECERLFVQMARDRQAIEDLVQDLERERETLQTIMENTYTQLAYLDPDFNFVRVNTAYATSAALGKEDMIGRNHFDLFPDQENQTIFEWVRDTGQPVQFYAQPFEFTNQPDRGTTYWDWTLVPVKDEQGQVKNLVLSLLDVTERVRARQELL